MTESETGTQDEIVIALKRLTAIIRDNRNRLLSGIVIGLLLGLLGYLVAKPYYTASAMLVAADASVQDNRNSSLSALTSLAGVAGPAQLSPFDRLQIVLKSKELARQILPDDRARMILFPGRWNPKARQWLPRTGLKAAIEYVVMPGSSSVPNVDATAARLAQHLAISPNKAAGTVVVGFNAGSHDDALYMLNLVLGRADGIVRRDYLEVAQGYTDYISHELPDVTIVTTRTALTDLMANYQQTIVMARVSLPFSFLAIDPASAPMGPSGPSIVLYAAAGALLGLAGAILYTLSAPLIRWRVAHQMSSITGA